jgi:hypothetical protein
VHGNDDQHIGRHCSTDDIFEQSEDESGLLVPDEHSVPAQDGDEQSEQDDAK